MVSAEMNNNKVDYVEILSEKGGTLKIINPFESDTFTTNVAYELNNDIITIQMTRNQTIMLQDQ